jgi:ribosomal protein L11 methyltransferase
MGFWQLTVPTSPDTSEGFTNFLWEQGALGVVEEEGPAEPPRVRAFFPDSASSTGLVADVAAYAAELRALGFATAPGEIEIAPLVEEAWASAWQQSFPPRAIGRRIWVRPSWERAEAPERVTVVIEPGRAFGTGTGILAIACLKLGALRVLGLDIDPDAIAAARRNAAVNDCADRLDLLLAGPELLHERPPFPLVLANLLAHTHIALAPRYHRLVAPGGQLILGGIMEHEDPEVVEALAGAGFALEEKLAIEGWSGLRLRAIPA